MTDTNIFKRIREAYPHLATMADRAGKGDPRARKTLSKASGYAGFNTGVCIKIGALLAPFEEIGLNTLRKEKRLQIPEIA